MQQQNSPKTSDINETTNSKIVLKFIFRLFKYYATNFDERAGEYMFENFLAMIAGGKWLGKPIDDDTVKNFEIFRKNMLKI